MSDTPLPNDCGRATALMELMRSPGWIARMCADIQWPDPELREDSRQVGIAQYGHGRPSHSLRPPDLAGWALRLWFDPDCHRYTIRPSYTGPGCAICGRVEEFHAPKATSPGAAA